VENSIEKDAETRLTIGPNPSSAFISIQFYLPLTGNVLLRIYDNSGRLITTLQDKRLPAGDYTLSYNVSELEKGTYICSLISGRESRSVPIIVQ
jgi:hypothetical protein